MKKNLEQDLIETAWGIMANVSGGDWDKQIPMWQEAASRWLNDYKDWFKNNRPYQDTEIEKELQIE